MPNGKSLGGSLGVYDPNKYDSLLEEEVEEQPVPRVSTSILPEDVEEEPLPESAEILMQRHMATSRRAEEGREKVRDWQYANSFGIGVVDPNEGFEFEGETGLDAVKLKQKYDEEDSEAAFLQPDPDVAGDPAEDSGDPWYTAQNVMNFLFSDEMGLAGLKWDNEGFTWNYDNFRNQLSEHPYTAAFTIAAYAVPIGLAWSKSAKIAKRAADLATDSGTAAGKGLLGTSLRYRFDDHSKLVKDLAFSEVNEGRELFSKGLVDKLRLASPDEVRKLMPERQLRKILINDFHQERFYELQSLAKAGKLDTPRLKASWSMWKTFGNKYFEKLNAASKEQIENLDRFFVKAQMGKYLASAPTRLGEKGNKAVYRFWAGDSVYDDLVKEVGDDSALWADSMRIKWTELFNAQADEGFIGPRTIEMFREKFGGFHLPAVKKGTAGFEDLGVTSAIPSPGQFGGLVRQQKLDPAKALTGPTTMRRGKLTTREATMEAMDEIVIDPASLTIGGFIRDNMLFQIHRTFRDIVVDSVSGAPKAANWFVPLDKLAGMPKYAQKNFINFEELDKVVPELYNTMHRMVTKEVEKRGLDPNILEAGLPAIDRSLVNQFFGRDGSARQAAGSFQRFFELLTGVHKTARTSLNPPTHMANLLGNFMFLSMAGMNPFGRQALNDGEIITKAYTNIVRMAHKSSADAKAGKAGAVFDTVESLLNKDTLAKVLGNNRYIKGVNDESIDLAEMFSDDLMKDLIEAQNFESIEGLVHVNKLLKQMERLEDSGWAESAVATVARSIAGVGEVKPVKKTLQTMSAAYLGEDMVPKMMYAMNLARKGWGRDAIIREVGRRLPQYRTVGALPQKTRRVLLPWITFPAEATRIMKNDMMDNPVAMMAWLQGPQIAQGVASGAGLGPDFSELDDLIEAAPPWGVRYQSVMLDEGTAPPFLGAVGGGAVGGIVGAATGGAKGALVGAAAGAAAGAGVGAMSPRRKEMDQENYQEFNRTWSLDFFPHSALGLGSFHPHEWEKINPFADAPTPGREVIQTAKDLSPVEPLAVFMPLLELYSGRGSFGQEIKSKSGIQFANKMASGLLGFLAPPMIQKYGMKIEGPGGAIIPMANVHEDNGGQLTLPKGLTATLGGLGAAGLTFLGAKAGLGYKGAPLLASTALSGVMGAGAGAEVNTRRLMTDLGLMGDPRTGEHGDWTLDWLSNTFFGVNKSWRVTPSQAEYNQSIRNKRFVEMRGSAVKDYMDAIRNGSESKAKAQLGAIYKSYLYEWADTKKARQKFLEWGERNSRMLMTLPQFAGMSEEYLRTRMMALLETVKDEGSRMDRQRLAEVMTELQRRRLRQTSGLKVLEP